MKNNHGGDGAKVSGPKEGQAKGLDKEGDKIKRDVSQMSE